MRTCSETVETHGFSDRLKGCILSQETAERQAAVHRPPCAESRRMRTCNKPTIWRMVAGRGGVEDENRMLMSLCPGETVQASMWRMLHDIETTKRLKSWQDGIKEMHEALEKVRTGSAVMEIFSPARVNVWQRD